MRNSKVFSMLVASALVTTVAAAGSAQAAAKPVKPSQTVAPAKTTAKFKVLNSNVQVDGQNSIVKTIQVGTEKLYAVRDLADAVSAGIQLGKGDIQLTDSHGYHTVSIRPNVKTLQVDGASQDYTTAPKVQDGVVYVELEATINALGAELTSTGIYSQQRLEGDFSSPSFNDQGQVIVTKNDGDALQVFALNAALGTPNQILTSNESAAGAAISPDRKWGAFANESGQLFVYDLANGLAKQVGADSSTKTDLIWSADGKKIYFIQGDKQEKISYITVEDGKITELLADKVENKSDLQVDATDKKIAYLVNVTGVAKNDADSTEDSLTIDYTGAGAQVYSLDTVTKGAKPVQLTKTTDNKLLPSFLSDGSLVYVSADPDDKAGIGSLKNISVDGTKTTDLVKDIDVTLDVVTREGKLIVAGIKADGKTGVFEVSATGTKTELYNTADDVSEVAVSKDGKLVLISGGKVVIVQGNKGIELTK
ncbi:Tol biopolymer transport system component [Paenibacillus shirakamiensis]|uniref:Tol biopolymer transport system component n=1 Tax=Paenibacillus shirakamiensis TaxID=1265935 RepID=A0ABS4JFE5_9BACL|nr:hypothetical protein [Paenibacillus shirakamiensis]MBP2000432.1 Tol biopolymer transport system component [Paenibacillus shirakamiensis]